MSKYSSVPEVTIEEHKKLIDSLDEDSYIYFFDARFRIAVVSDNSDFSYYILACSTTGTWYCIDWLPHGLRVVDSILACIKALIVAYNNDTLDKELRINGYRWQV